MSNRPYHKSIRLRGYDYRQPGAYFVSVCVDRRACCLGDIGPDGFAPSAIGQTVQSCWSELGRRFPTILTDSFVIMPNHVHGIIFLGANPNITSRVAHDGHERSSTGAINRAATDETAITSPNPVRTSTGAINRASTNEPAITSPSPVSGAEVNVVARFIAPASPKDVRSMHSRKLPSLGEVVREFKAKSTHLIRTSGSPSFLWQRNYYEHIIRNDAFLERVRDYIAGNPGKWAEDEENPSRVTASG